MKNEKKIKRKNLKQECNDIVKQNHIDSNSQSTSTNNKELDKKLEKNPSVMLDFPEFCN